LFFFVSGLDQAIRLCTVIRPFSTGFQTLRFTGIGLHLL